MTFTDQPSEEVAAALGVEDVLVFELSGDHARLRGGSGRGAGWAGVVELNVSDEPRVQQLLDGGGVVRLSEAAPVHVVGPYWSAHAALARTGDHFVVVGAPEPIRASTAELTRRAAEAVAAIGDVPPSKLLADELEVVHAVRQLTDHAPRTVAETAAHVADVASDALACEIGVVLLLHDGETKVHGGGPAWADLAGDKALCAALHELARRAAEGPVVEQDLAAAGVSGLRIVSCYALGIGRSEPLGALIVGHTDARPRGFTQLCQRVGRALADASEPALRQAMAHEELAAQRDRFAQEARTDPLTGLGNRTSWGVMLAIEQARWERHHRSLVLLSIDLDNLKATNDRFGHTVGDELLIAAANVLRGALRGGDVIARVGGDEFAAILPDADGSSAEAVQRRVRAASAAWRGSHDELSLSISIGWASPAAGERLLDAYGRADAAMYQAKRGGIAFAG